MRRRPIARISERRVAVTKAVVEWYLTTYFGTEHDPGLPAMFCDPQQVGAFAVSPEALAAGTPQALFRMLVACSLFQRRQDQQVLRILRGIPAKDVDELASSSALLKLANSSSCRHARTLEGLLTCCDLNKDYETGAGTCQKAPDANCHMKRHTVLLKRYGHFGKVPTSMALMLQESGDGDLASLYRRVHSGIESPRARAEALERELSKAWRINQKIAAMYLSLLCNPDLSPHGAPWADGIDWTYFVVLDSNVDLFLTAIGYTGPWTYEARREFVTRLAQRIDLAELRPGLHSFNPRLVQQAMYLFMSMANRRAANCDCSKTSPPSCGSCHTARRYICPIVATDNVAIS